MRCEKINNYIYKSRTNNKNKKQNQNQTYLLYIGLGLCCVAKIMDLFIRRK